MTYTTEQLQKGATSLSNGTLSLCLSNGAQPTGGTVVAPVTSVPVVTVSFINIVSEVSNKSGIETRIANLKNQKNQQSISAREESRQPGQGSDYPAGTDYAEASYPARKAAPSS